MINIAARVGEANEYMANRLGKTITYKRYATESYSPETGATIIWFEQPSFTAIPLSASGSEIDNSSGRVEVGDIAFTFKKEEFSDYSTYKYLPFTAGSTEFTVGETLSGVTGGATGVVVSEYVDSGTWVLGTAAGVVWLSGVTGTFEAENLNGSASGNNCATIASDSTSGGTDLREPHSGDVIVYNDSNYSVDLDGKVQWRLDPSAVLYRVFSRRLG